MNQFILGAIKMALYKEELNYEHIDDVSVSHNLSNNKIVISYPYWWSAKKKEFVNSEYEFELKGDDNTMEHIEKFVEKIVSFDPYENSWEADEAMSTGCDDYHAWKDDQN